MRRARAGTIARWGLSRRRTRAGWSWALLDSRGVAIARSSRPYRSVAALSVDLRRVGPALRAMGFMK